LRLIITLVWLVCLCARTLAILVCVDGLASYVIAVLRVFRHPIYTGRHGRPRLVLEKELQLGQVVKRYVRRRVVSVERRPVRGTDTEVNATYIERLNATFRASLAPLICRGRASAHTATVLAAGMWLVGCAYHFCWLHQSLRLAVPAGASWEWQECTPAMAAGLTKRQWTMRELMRYQVPHPAWVTPNRQSRPPKQALQAAYGRGSISTVIFKSVSINHELLGVKCTRVSFRMPVVVCDEEHSGCFPFPRLS
jgi:hypothetical protein